jgi:putative two-component system response regulator
MSAIQEQAKFTILVVDDEPINRMLLAEALGSQYLVMSAEDGETCLAMARSTTNPPDLILLDIMMPVMDGYEVCRRLKADPLTRHMPVIFVSAKSDPDDERMGLEIGAVDFVHKPVSFPVLLARVASHLALKTQGDLLRTKNDDLELQVQARTQELVALQDVAMVAMALLAEVGDADTLPHIRRTQHYVKALADQVRDRPPFAGQLTDDAIQAIFRSVPLHDIGNAGIPDRVLLKPGRLSPGDIAIMNTHTQIGLDVIEQAERSMGTPLPFLTTAKDIVLAHHERWDGRGYPQGLAGTAIPLCARLTTIADVYDALITPRVYKAGMSHQEAMHVIFQERGQHFDPDLVDAFVEIQDEISAITERFPDTPDGMEKKIQYMIAAIAEEA